MKIESFHYLPEKGWSVKSFPQLDSPETAVFIFGASQYFPHSSSLDELLTFYSQSHKIGGSTAGEVVGDRVFDGSLSVAVAKFEKTHLKSASVSIEKIGGPFEAGKKIAEDLNGPDLCGVFVLSDGLKINGSELTRGLHSVISPTIPVTGGLAGDGARFKETWIIGNSGAESGSVCAIGFYGRSLQFAHGSQGGWDIFGPERHVTKSNGNKLFELDGKPALELYKEYLGEKASELPASALLFPLAIRVDEGSPKQIVRTVLSVDESDQSMTFAGDIPQDCRAQLMRANFDRLIEGAYMAAATMGEIAYALEPVLAIAISCVGRKLVLGPRIEEEIDATRIQFPNHAHQIGFYSYGEISPFTHGEGCELHNQTMTLTALKEG